MVIKAGDNVNYLDVVSVKKGNKTFKSKIAKQGVWDGTKVILDDKEKTTVYKLEWLTPAWFDAKRLKEICIELKLEYSGTPYQVFYEIPYTIARNKPYPAYMLWHGEIQRILAVMFAKVADKNPVDILYKIVFPNSK